MVGHGRRSGGVSWKTLSHTGVGVNRWSAAKTAANELTHRGAGLKPGPPARQNNNNNNNTGDGSAEDESVSLPQHHGNVRMYRRVFAVGGGGGGGGVMRWGEWGLLDEKKKKMERKKINW